MLAWFEILLLQFRRSRKRRRKRGVRAVKTEAKHVRFVGNSSGQEPSPITDIMGNASAGGNEYDTIKEVYSLHFLPASSGMIEVCLGFLLAIKGGQSGRFASDSRRDSKHDSRRCESRFRSLPSELCMNCVRFVNRHRRRFGIPPRFS